MTKAARETAAAAALALGFTLLAAGFMAQSPVAGTEEWPADDTVTVAVEIGREGFDPGEIALEKDVPARIVFTRTVEKTCAKMVHIPGFGVEAVALPLNEPVAIEVDSSENGTFTFACAMDMIKGAILVRSD